MSSEPRRRLTEDEYLAIERTSPTRHEFVDGRWLIECLPPVADIYHKVKLQGSDPEAD